jgi:hypothetical protein
MKFTNKSFAIVVLVITAFVLAILQWLSTGVYAETDSITHYQLARYAFKYPEFFLNHWGKPLFTILAAPLSQFGYAGAVAFNLLCGLLSGWFAYLIARQLGFRHAWAAIVFTVFTPLYIFIMYTSLTEILFSLVLIVAIYLFVSRRFIWSAVVISLIPFARTEGVMFVVLFIPALLWMKQYKSLPFLLAGFVFFSLLGLPYYHDFFWFFTQMPYTTDSSLLYGKGSFWYYFMEMDYMLNFPLLILTGTGFIFILLNMKKGLQNLRDTRYATLYFLIIPSIFGFILAQSFLWWRGMGILASTRFIACVLPLTAVIAVTGFDWVMEKARFSKLIYLPLGVFILGLVVYKPFTYNKLPMKTAMNLAVMEHTAEWLKSSQYSGRKAFYTDPAFPFYMDMDPFDQQKCFKIYSYIDIDPARILKPGELLIWDAQFAGYEGRLPFDSLMNNDKLRLLNIFTPVEGFTIIGGEKYKIAVFMKAPRDTSRSVYKEFYHNDFENLPAEQSKFTSNQFSQSGRQSIVLNPEHIYSPSTEGKLKYLPGISNISLKVSVRVMNPSPDEKGDIILVVGIDDAEQKMYKYLITKDSETDYKPGEWFTMTRTDVVDRNIPPGGSYKAYVWYTGKNKIYVDDLKLEYMPVGYE